MATCLNRVMTVALMVLGASSPIWAQTQSDQERPATTTPAGDTGLWFLPTAEVLGGGQWSTSAYRVNYDREQGFTDISHFLGTGAFGVGDRAEVFASMRFVTRVDRDIRPLFTSNPDVGGVAQDVPLMNQGWGDGRATCSSARRSTCSPSAGGSPWLSPSAARSRCRPGMTTPAWVRARPTCGST